MIAETISPEIVVQDGCIHLPYSWTVGATGTRFLTELRDKTRIWGTRCEACGKVFVPPRKSCPRCLTEPLDWIEVGPSGTLQTFTVIHAVDPSIHPVDAPFAYGVILLDGASTGLVHLLGEVDLQEIASGMRVEAVFEAERAASILDIKYFRPIQRSRTS